MQGERKFIIDCILAGLKVNFDEKIEYAFGERGRDVVFQDTESTGNLITNKRMMIWSEKKDGEFIGVDDADITWKCRRC